ncbi:MAG: hypothetical protein ACE5DM_03200 [Candidatus Nanoarchaeia archaeon]
MADYKEMSLGECLRYYKRQEIQQAIADCAVDKEVVGSYGGKGYAKRPDVLLYPSDVLELVKKGITSFHASEELWKNPLLLQPSLSKRELDDIRKGWDLVLDIDCTWLEYSGLAAKLLIDALRYHGIRSLSVKFSGNHGYHIGVPFESFPDTVHDTPTKNWFPEGPRKIAEYLKHMIKDHLGDAILGVDNIDTLQEKTGKSFEELVVDGKFNPFMVLDLDTILISPRHLYRMPYSFNEKSRLVSLPIDPDKVLDFKKEDATPDKILLSEFTFLGRENVVKGEATKLLVQAFDFVAEREEKKEMKEKSEGMFKKTDFEPIQEAIPEQCFPPCIKKILAGVEDGRKRSMFVLVNFLSSVGWNHKEIEERMLKWNEANPEPLREVLLKGQVRYHKQHNKQVLPPNCDNKMYYKDMQFCNPDTLCGKIKNPVNYSARKARFLQFKELEEKKKVKNVEKTAIDKEVAAKEPKVPIAKTDP